MAFIVYQKMDDMTPKEKAKELINKFFPDLKSITEMGFSHGRKNYAVKCALICVDEIIEDYKNSIKAVPEFVHMYFGGLTYWQEVKNEIEMI